MRRRRSPIREIIPDAKYNSVMVTRLINSIMLDGKKSIIEKAVYGDDKTSTTSGLIANQKNLIEIVINGTEESPSLVSSVKDLRGNITAVNNSINILQKQYNSINKTVKRLRA